MAGKPRRAVLRKAADAGVHPAEPRVARIVARPAKPRTGSVDGAGSSARAARSGGGRAGSD